MARRGADPALVEAGDGVTGVTIMRVDALLDHGPMLAVETTAIDPDDHARAGRAALGARAEALLTVLRDVERGAAVETPQEHEHATLAPKIDKSEGEVRFEENPKAIYDRFRAFDPWPGIYVQAAARRSSSRTSALSLRAANRARSCRSRRRRHRRARRAIRVIEMQRPANPAPRPAPSRAIGVAVGSGAVIRTTTTWQAPIWSAVAAAPAFLCHWQRSNIQKRQLRLPHSKTSPCLRIERS